MMNTIELARETGFREGLVKLSSSNLRKSSRTAIPRLWGKLLTNTGKLGDIARGTHILGSKVPGAFGATWRGATSPTAKGLGLLGSGAYGGYALANSGQGPQTPGLSGDRTLTHQPYKGTAESQTPYRLGKTVGGYMKDSPVFQTFGKAYDFTRDNPYLATGIGAGAGYLGGQMYDWFRGGPPRDRFGRPKSRWISPQMIGALLGAGGAGLTGYLANRQTKQSYFALPDASSGSGHDLAYIESQLQSDPSLGYGEKSSLMDLLDKLSNAQIGNLASVLKGSLGAAAGMVVARYLLKAGIGTQIVAAILGGLTGSQLGAGSPVNAVGNPVDTASDVFGRDRLI